MRRIFFAVLSLSFLLSFTSCDNDSDRIRLGYDFVSTVIEKEEGKVVLTLDGGVKYYESGLLNSKSENFEVGDRLYLNFFRINYDDQPDNASGTKSSPYFFSDLIYNKMNLVNEVLNSPAYDQLADDALTYICQPYIQTTEIGNEYLNIFGEVKDATSPEFNLIYMGENKDTLEYKLKVTFKTTPGSAPKIARFAKTFLLDKDLEDKKIKIEFNSNYYEINNKCVTSDSTFVISYNK